MSFGQPVFYSIVINPTKSILQFYNKKIAILSKTQIDNDFILLKQKSKL